MAVLIGCSGWQYRDWRESFYPKGVAQKRWLEFYAERFQTVEINNSFYMLPKPETFGAWNERTPDDFVLVVKANRYITHIRRLKDVGESVERFMTNAARLGAKLGPILVQLPPNLKKSVPALRDTLDVFQGYGVPVTVEFRHDTWYDDEVQDLLASKNVPLTLADREEQPIQPWWVTADWGYIRFHHGVARPRPCYTRDGLKKWVEEIASRWSPDADVYVFFNNDPRCCAVHDAIVFAEECAAAGLKPTRVPRSDEVSVIKRYQR